MAQNLKECRRHGTNAVKKKNAEKSKYEQYEQHDIIDRIKHQYAVTEESLNDSIVQDLRDLVKMQCREARN